MKFTIDVPKDTKPVEFTKYIMKALVDHVSEKKIKLFSFPQPEAVFFDGEKLTFETEIIEAPPVKLCDYRNIPITMKHKEIPVDDVDKAVDFLRAMKDKELGKTLTDVEFSKIMGHYSIETLKSAIQLEMFREKEKINRLDSIEQISDYLLKNCRVSIPGHLLDQLSTANYHEEVKKWVAGGNMITNIPKDGRKKVRQKTEEETKLRLIFDAIIDKEKIVSENPYQTCIDKLLLEAKIIF